MTTVVTAPVGVRLLSVVVPVFNESKTVSTVIDRIRATALPIELIVVDDGSTDDTRDVLERERPRIDRLILLDRNRGKGAAVKAGFAAATVKPGRRYSPVTSSRAARAVAIR